MVMTPATLAATAEAVAFGASWWVTVVVLSLEAVDGREAEDCAAGAAGAAGAVTVTGASVVTGPVVAARAAVAGIAISGLMARTSVARFTFLFTLRLRIVTRAAPAVVTPWC